MAKFKRILLKLSGESLMGEQRYGIDEKRLAEYAEQIKEVHDMGDQLHRHRRRQHIPRPERCRKGIRPCQRRPNGHVRHGHQFARTEQRPGSHRRKKPRADRHPHGAYRRVLQQMESHRVHGSRRSGYHERRHGQSLFHDRHGFLVARH